MNAWTDLGGGIFVRQSRAFQMNSVALLAREHAVLVDPGVLPSELDDIAARVRDANPAQVTLFITHAHWDHVLGRSWWPAAGVIAHDRFPADLERTMAWVHEEAETIASKHGESWPRRFESFRPTERVAGLHFRRIGPWRAVFRDAFGHSASQLSLHLPEARVLIAADMLSDIEIPMLETQPPVYRATLEALRPLFEGGAIETLVPGHGTIARGVDAAGDRFRRDLAYLETLERETRRLHAGGASLADAQARLSTVADVERHPHHPMREIHLENIQHAYKGIDAASRPHR